MSQPSACSRTPGALCVYPKQTSPEQTHHAQQQRDPLRSEIRREALQEGMLRPETPMRPVSAT